MAEITQEWKPLVISLGEVLWDMLPEGKTAGGAPVNFIYHAMQDGVDGYSVSALGNDQLGSELEETVRKAGIPYYFERNDYPTGTAGIMAGDDDTFSYSITEGAAWDHLRETDEVQKIISRADGITYGTLALRSPESRQTILNLIDDAPTSCLRFFDVNLRGDYYDRDLIDQLLRLSTHFKMNQSEFAFLKSLLGMEEANEDGMDDEEACAWFFRHYPNLRMIAMTAGRSYSLVMSADGRASRIRTPHVNALNSVGAGDVFSGVLAAEILRGAPMEEGHQKAVNVAAYVCTQRENWTPLPDSIPDYVTWQHLRETTVG
ncbi:fructokinase [Parascardovia denticolens IPLA 20019]|uniref:Kinase, PfkB family n=1 Tax=Parascardovia denticolens DSM 10105 = JCM 12538 TaxID=864564 RepID=E6JZA8_PARDN|nr:PfkB family carbohydrate kinase [Parascardovia denticolens]EFG33549.1 hypothetical protein HMPREF9017_00969 [Parascardovia denticolens F0305]EFT83998.1 kinase, PfkB family [Parascardovia denticolens DSM 10105 = JCM 12538]EIT88362.1 fructokinase [Parascardovia denticolens IPLA 20019]BAR05160.1 sugar kinase [Parascardovia denticolens DSM 10105 = JCM 12538]